VLYIVDEEAVCYYWTNSNSELGDDDDDDDGGDDDFVSQLNSVGFLPGRRRKPEKSAIISTPISSQIE